MKIILISYYFPPDPAVGSLRVAKVAEALSQVGHTVHVVAADSMSRRSGTASTVQGVTVHRVRPLPHVRELYAAVKRRFSTGTPSQTSVPSDSALYRPADQPRWKRCLLSMIWLPDDRQGFILPAIHLTRRIAARSGVDLVYTSAPPHSLHLTGWILKRVYGMRWIAEFRDPWTDSPKGKHVRSSLSDAIERWLEMECLSSADSVIAVTASAAATLGARMGNDGQKVHVVRNGIDNLRPAHASSPNGDPIRVVYLGNLYHFRDPRPFLAAVATARVRLGLTPATLQIDFVGQCSHYRGVPTAQTVAEFGLQDIVNLREPVPHQQCEQILNDATVLLLLAQNQPMQVPNKLYEYLAARKPILAFADEDGETAAMLRAAGNHFVVTSDQSHHVERVVTSALDQSFKFNACSRDDILAEWSTRAQMDHLQALIGEYASC